MLLGDVSGKSAFVVLARLSPSSALSSCAGRDLRVGSSLETQTVRPPRPVAWEREQGVVTRGGGEAGEPAPAVGVCIPRVQCRARRKGRDSRASQSVPHRSSVQCELAGSHVPVFRPTAELPPN